MAEHESAGAGEAAGTLERKEDAGKGEEGEVKRWLLEWDLADKAEKDWRKDAKEVNDQYSGKTNTRHNILWSNVETLRPTLYDTAPAPDVRRRFPNQGEGETPEEKVIFKAQDQLNRDVSEVIERALVYTLDAYDFDEVMSAAILDYLLTGRAVARVKYLPLFSKTTVENTKTGEDEDVQQVVDEDVKCESVPWEDFRRGPGKKWADVAWVGFIHRMTREKLDKTFGKEISAKVELDDPIQGSPDKVEKDSETIFKRAIVYEIWDESSKRVLYIAPSYKDGFLKREADPLGLKDFFPVPRPLYSVDSPDSLVPVPEYELYKDLAQELDAISRRIKSLIKMLKVNGFYDGTVTGIDRLMDAPDGTLLAATNAQRLTDNGGLHNAIFFMPIEQISKVLAGLYVQREDIKNQIYEITGVSDIVRGVSDPRETAAAQNIKSQFGSLRLKRRQKAVARFARDLIRMKAEIISEKFDPEILQRIVQKAVTPDMLEVMRGDKMRDWRIDIETDSTIAGQQANDQEAVTKLLQGIGGYVQTMAPAVQQGMFPLEVAAAILKSAIRKFRFGREVEDILDKIRLPEQGEEGQPGKPQGPTPEQQAQQAEQQAAAQAAQMEEQKAQAELKIKESLAQADIQAKQVKAEGELALAQKKLDAEIQLDRDKAHAEINLKQEEIRLKHEVELEKARNQPEPVGV